MGARSRFSALALVLGICLAAILTIAGPAAAAGRVALVVGNSDYRYVNALANPARDARLMAKTLKRLGFRLVGGAAQVNLDKSSFDRVVEDFGSAAQGADVAMFYYAGHGLQIDGTNYLVPVDANPHKKADVDFQMLDVNSVLREMEGADARLNIVVLDACRNNPFAGRGLRALGGGLAQMEAPEGTLISFSTQPGNVALDGAGKDSPFTTALAEVLPRPGLDLFRAFNQVGLIVSEATDGEQRPWVSSSPIKGDFYFAGPRRDPLAAERRSFEAAQKIDTAAAWDSFLARYKDGFFAGLARAERDRVLANARADAATATQARAKAAAAVEAQAKAQAAAAAAPAQAKAAVAASEKVRREKEAEIARLKAEMAAFEQARQNANAKAIKAAAEKAASEAAAKAAQEVAERIEQQAAAGAGTRKGEKLAALTPPNSPKLPALPSTIAGAATKSPVLNSSDLVQLLKLHLRRVGCDPGDDTGKWGSSARRALGRFNKYARTRLDVKAPTLATLDAVQARSGRVCPLVCGKGTRREGDQCVAITCRHGYVLDAKGVCKRQRNSASRSRKSKSSSGRIIMGSPEQLRLKAGCKAGNLGACRTLCNAGGTRACRHLAGGGGRHHGHHHGYMFYVNSGRRF